MIYRIAGAIGIDPRPLTLRELLAMHRGHRENQWAIASSVMALIANCNSDKKRYKPDDFNPFASKQKAKPVVLGPKESVELLCKVFGVNG